VISLLLFYVPGLKNQDKSPREYFEELNAGAFIHTLTSAEGNKISAPDPGYACFSKNNLMADNGGVFLTFEAMAYDKNYAEAEAMLASKPNAEDTRKALARMREIQEGYSYVMLFSDDLMAAMPADASDFLRKGGQELDLSLYMHGVKSWTAGFHRSRGNENWVSRNGKSDFAVEPSTMRFLWSVHGDKPQMINGRCERIYKDKK